MYYRHWFTEEKTPENWIALQMHLSLGVTLSVFILLRIIWRLMNKTPRDVPGTRLEHMAARTVHLVLYAMMIIMPVTGYLGTGVNTEFFLQFDIPKFSDTQLYKVVVEGWLGLTWEAFEAPVDFVHKNSGEYFVWALILLHAGAALYHHFIRKDVVLKRMISIK